MRAGRAWTAVGLLVAIPAGCAAWIAAHGISARDQPTGVEKVLARTLRHLGIPPAQRRLANPVPLTPEALTEGRMHWADHCALCHGNDGRGQTEIGRNLFPKAPDMTLNETQRLSDGELRAIIAGGVRLTGMPAWGSADGKDDEETWKLVHFIRHLPKITPEESRQMDAMNPVSPMRMRQDREEAEFLSGAGPGAPAAAGRKAP
jgi:mono/diheme cytochrome c family protein